MTNLKQVLADAIAERNALNLVIHGLEQMAKARADVSALPQKVSRSKRVAWSAGCRRKTSEAVKAAWARKRAAKTTVTEPAPESLDVAV